MSMALEVVDEQTTKGQQCLVIVSCDAVRGREREVGVGLAAEPGSAAERFPPAWHVCSGLASWVLYFFFYLGPAPALWCGGKL